MGEHSITRFKLYEPTDNSDRSPPGYFCCSLHLIAAYDSRALSDAVEEVVDETGRHFNVRIFVCKYGKKKGNSLVSPHLTLTLAPHHPLVLT